MADLITTARALYNLDNLSTTSAENTTLAALVSACSRAIQAYCRRQFVAQSFDELYDGLGQPVLLLRHYPLLSIERIASNPTPVVRIRNGSASNQRASVAVSATGLGSPRAPRPAIPASPGRASPRSATSWMR